MKKKQKNILKGNSIPTVYAVVHDTHKLTITYLIFMKLIVEMTTTIWKSH